jgi:diaminohydroxyphosphoribosylaminopyrimidine deaminase/5-amino-6-(5-phosphoribosylamino)uracil reductase
MTEPTPTPIALPLPPETSTAADRAPTPDTSTDAGHMAAALELARGAIGLSDPNPRVGCVIVDRQGRVIGSGHTQRAGGSHAEVMALRDVQSRGADATGATVYVTLEPCAHHGRTPPCCDALIAARVGQVVAAVHDPNPLVAGQGLARLAGAGMATRCGLLADEARELNIGFFSRMLRARPWVRIKAAASLDGRTALDNGVSQWITSAAARSDGHTWRRRAGAVLTGMGTLRGDDPRLDVRLVPTELQPLRVLVDSTLQVPADARMLQPPGSTLIYTTPGRALARPDLGSDSVEIATLPAGPHGHVDLGQLLADLARRGINELHVEAGAGLNGALHAAGWVDEWLIYLAPCLLGSGRGIAALAPLETLDAATRLEWTELCQVGPDLRLRARPVGRLGSWLAAP